MSIAHANTDTKGTSASAGATTIITLPTGVASTSIVVVVFGNNQTTASAPNTVTAPAGWTQIGPAGGAVNTTVHGTRVQAFWALGNVSSKTFTNGTTGQSEAWCCAEFTGVDNSTPIDVAAAAGSSSTSSATLTVTGVTIATVNAWLCMCGADWNGGVYTATGFTVGPTSTADVATALLYNTTPVSTGATGNQTLNDSASATGQVIVGFAFALRPAAAGTPVQSGQLCY